MLTGIAIFSWFESKFLSTLFWEGMKLCIRSFYLTNKNIRRKKEKVKDIRIQKWKSVNKVIDIEIEIDF